MSRPKKPTGLFLAIAVLLAFGCASGPQLSPMQKRQTTTKLVEGFYEDIYRATMTVLQDQDYVIENTDMETGLIVAKVRRAKEEGIPLFGIQPIADDKLTEIEITCVVNILNDTNSEVRLSILETTYDKSSKKDARQIYDPIVYQNFFNQIIVEVKRREAMK